MSRPKKWPRDENEKRGPIRFRFLRCLTDHRISINKILIVFKNSFEKLIQRDIRNKRLDGGKRMQRYLYQVGLTLLFHFAAWAAPNQDLFRSNSTIKIEGVYAVHLSCSSQSDESSLCSSVEPIDRLVILDTGTPRGLIARFFSKIKSDSGFSWSKSYLFTELTAQFDSNWTVGGDSSWDSTGVQDRVRIALNHFTGDIYGQLISTQSIGIMNFEGKRLISPSEFLFNKISEDCSGSGDKISGRYHVQFVDEDSVSNLASLEGDLILKNFGDFNYRASYLGKKLSPYIEFKTGHLVSIENAKILSLTSFLSEKDFVKWVVIPQGQTCEAWRGMGFSSKNSKFYRFAMSKAGDVDPVPYLLRHLFY